jgi:exodeoxyribonuclease V alpha subunit
MSELAELFAAAGVPPSHVAPVTARLGGAAADRLREDPWRLLLVPGIRPGQADHFARGVLGDQAGPADERRCRALVTHLLTEAAREGHTATPVADVLSALSALRVPDAERAVEAALDEATVMVFEEEPDPEDFEGLADAGEDGPEELPEPARTLALARHGLAEEAVAEGVVRLAATAEPLLGDDALADPASDARSDVPPDRLVAATAAVRCGVSVMTGADEDVRQTVAELAAIAAARGRGARVAVATVTARAAAGLAVPDAVTVTTTHRLLDAREAGDGIAFAHGEQRPLEVDLLIVPDASALDVELAAALVEACPEGCHLVLCGDPDALPPAGPGRVFADLVESRTVPVTPLAPSPAEGGAEGGADAPGGLVRRLAEAVGRGELPRLDSPEHEVVIVPATADGEAVHRAVQLVGDSIPRALGIPVEDVQVVTAARGGTAGAVALNRALKDRLNPGPGAHGGFDVGDRVVVYGALAQAATGETGVVGTVTADGLEIVFPDGPAAVPARLLPRLRHGWAVTVDQAHGTRWPAVVAVLPAEAAGALSRPLVAMAFTRALRHLSVVQAAGPALARAVRADGTPATTRRTRLTGLLRG